MNREFGGQLSPLARQYSLCVRSLEEPRKSIGIEHAQDQIFPAASVIKAGIMSCLLRDVQEGRLSLEETVEFRDDQVVGGAGVLFELGRQHNFRLEELCRLMMVVSDNTASNACLRAVGMDRLNDFFNDRGYKANVQRFFMNPVIDGRDNTMSAESAVLMMADIYNGLGLSEKLKDFAIGCLRRQQYREKIPLLLPEEVVVGHKTGELLGVRHDAAVVETDQPYLIAIFTSEGGAPWSVDRAMAEVSLDVFDFMTSSRVQGCQV